MPHQVSVIRRPWTPVCGRVRDELGTVVAADQLGRAATPHDDRFECCNGVVGAHAARRWGRELCSSVKNGRMAEELELAGAASLPQSREVTEREKD